MKFCISSTRTFRHVSAVNRDQFSYLGNRARYEFIELDMSTGLDFSIPSSRPLTFPGGQSENDRARWLIELDELSSSVTYRARWLIELGFSREEKKRKNGNSDQFSFLGNRARYELIELDMSTGLDLSIPSSRPLTFPGGQSENGYRARWLIELDDLSSSVTYRARFFKKRKKEKKWKLRQ